MKRGKKESYVISARLSEANADERRALEILNEWEGKGHTRRYIVTAALLRLGNERIPPPAPPQVEGVDIGPLKDMLFQEMGRMVDRLGRIAEDLASADQRGLSRDQVDKLGQEASGISRQFRNSMRAAVDFGDDDE